MVTTSQLDQLNRSQVHTCTRAYVCVRIGSGASSSSDSEVGCLQSGVCAKQKYVSSRDTYIARESLELLVTCLQLRSPLLG